MSLMLKPAVLTRVFLVASLIFVGVLSEQTVAASAEKKSAVPFCAAKNLSERSVVLSSPGTGKYATGLWKISLIFTNHGTTACSLSGVPKAQPVIGSKHTPVGPNAHSGPMPGWKGVSAVLAARKGTTNVHYEMRVPATTYPVAQCGPRNADGIVITFYTPTKVLLNAYFRTVKTQVCTKWLSTSIGGKVPVRLGNLAALGCTLLWVNDSSVWPRYQGQSLDAALQASATAFSEFGPVVFEKWTGPQFLPSEAGADNPWYLAFTKDGHKGLGTVSASLRTDGTAHAFLGPYCE
jgi:hypothetical protein